MLLDRDRSVYLRRRHITFNDLVCSKARHFTLEVQQDIAIQRSGFLPQDRIRLIWQLDSVAFPLRIKTSVTNSCTKRNLVSPGNGRVEIQLHGTLDQ